jgi:hypothetical protein
MRFLLKINIPNEPFNTLVREGTAGQKIGNILEETKPESIYFSEQDGQRGAIAVYNIENNSDVPAISEPWFLSFNASVQFNVAMTPEDLGKAGLDALGKKWA